MKSVYIKIDSFENVKRTQRIQYNCTECNKEVKRVYRNDPVMLCKRCRSQQTIKLRYGDDWKKFRYEKMADNLEKKYGVRNVSQLDSVKKKKEETCMNHFGTKHNLSAPEVRKKIEQTCLKKYGHKTSLASKACKEGIQRMIEKRKVDSSFNEKIMKKTRQTNLKKYGKPYYFQTKEYKQKQKQYFKNLSKEKKEEIQNKIKNTCLKKYGSECVFTSDYFFKNFKFKRFLYDGTYFDSSWELATWIYYKEHNMPIERNHRKFILDNGHYCFPDFITKDGLLEIKGDHLVKMKDWPYKQRLYEKEHIKVFFYKDVKPFIEYCLSTKSEDFLIKYKLKRYRSGCKKNN